MMAVCDYQAADAARNALIALQGGSSRCWRRSSRLPGSHCPAAAGVSGLIAEPCVQRERRGDECALEDMTKKKPEPTAEATAAEEMVRRAREQGPVPDQPGRAAEAADQDRAEPGDDRAPGPRKHGRPVSASGNAWNGTQPKTVLTESTGQVGIDVPRDRDGTFEPQIVKSGSGSWRASMRSCCPCMPRGLTTFSDRFPAAETY